MHPGRLLKLRADLVHGRLHRCRPERQTLDDETDDDEKISYNFQVRPILSDKCYNCHGPDANKREAGLRLDKLKAKLAKHLTNTGQPLILQAVDAGKLPTPTKAIRERDDQKEAAKVIRTE